MEKQLSEVVNWGAWRGHGSYRGAESGCQMGPWHGVQPGETPSCLLCPLAPAHPSMGSWWALPEAVGDNVNLGTESKRARRDPGVAW